jgi:hypothetical protein
VRLDNAREKKKKRQSLMLGLNTGQQMTKGARRPNTVKIGQSNSRSKTIAPKTQKPEAKLETPMDEIAEEQV